MAVLLTARTGRPISAAGVRGAARRGDIPYLQNGPGRTMFFDPLAVLATGYLPNLPRGQSEHRPCSNPRCKSTVEVSAYARRSYKRHFCSWECKYAAPGAWNPGGGRRGPRSTDWRAAFLKALRAGASVAAAAEQAGVASATPYRHRAKDESFRVEWDAALPGISARKLERSP